MKKLNLGIFTHDFYPFIGGMGRFVYEFYKQNEKYNNLNLFIFSPSDNTLRNHIQIFPETRNSILKNIEFSYKVHKSIDQFIREYNLDIINFQSGPGGVFFIKDVTIPVTFTSHHTYWQQSHYIKEQQWKKVFYLYERKGFLKADAIICDCKSTKNILTEHYGIKKEIISVIPIGIDTSTFTSKKHPGNPKELLYVGRIDKRKGVDFLLRALVMVHKEDPKVKLHIVGRGADKARMENFATEHHLPVIFHGFLTDNKITNLYEQISLQIVPSVFEGFGLSVIEGMARNIPIIATDVDGIRDIITSGESGLLVPFGNETLLAQSILRVSNEASLKSKLIKNAQKELLNYDWEKIYVSHVEAFTQISS